MSQKNALVVLGLCLVLAACNKPDDVTAPAAESQDIGLLAGNTWATRHPTLPPARAEMQAGTINNIIYVVGGSDSRTPGTFNTIVNVDAYNATTNTWTRRHQLPSARTAMNGVSVINGKLYMTGGWRQIPPASITATRTLFVYNPGTNTWVKKADMPRSGREGAQAVINGLLYVYTTDFEEHGLFRYNPATNTWTTLRPPPREHIAGVAGVINGKLYLAGGFSASCCNTAAVHVYDPTTNRWATKASMHVPRFGVAGGVISGKLYVAGGLGGPGRATLEVYNPVANTWTTKASMPTGRSSAASAVASGKLFVIGGYISSGQVTKVEAYTP